MVELEGSAEHAHETIREHVAEGHYTPSTPRWFTYVALSTLIMALLSAFAALMAAISAHESLLERTQEIVDFVALETDRIEVEILTSKHDLLLQFDEAPATSELERVRTFREDVKRMAGQTAEDETIVRTTTHAHIVFAIAVTLLSIGITLGRNGHHRQTALLVAHRPGLRPGRYRGRGLRPERHSGRMSSPIAHRDTSSTANTG